MPPLDSLIPPVHVLRLLALFLCIYPFSGCSLTFEATKTPRSPTEQLLLAESLQRSLVDTIALIPSGQAVGVETVGLTADQAFVTARIERWLSREGFNLPKDGKEPVVARVNLDAFGTLQNSTFFGLPAINAGLFPLALPELALYKAQRQRGLTRLSVDFLERSTGRLIRSTPAYEGDAFYNEYTILFILSFRETDLVPGVP